MIVLGLDTSAYSLLMRGQESLEHRLEHADRILLPTTVLGELHAGFERGRLRERNRKKLEDFLLLPGVSVVNVTDNVAERYGKLVAELFSLGTPIPTNDIWIAASILESGARLLAYDDHFNKVPGLIVESP